VKLPLIHTHDLNFAFGTYRVLNKINLSVPEGSIFGFLGPNGAGKTTTIKILLGLLQTTRGKVFLFDQDISHNALHILAKTGTMVETPTVYPHLSGKENVDIVRILRNLPRERTQEVLKRVGLWDDAKRPAGQYSTGMKQRLSLAVALLGNPELLILDEPMNGLDPSGIIEIREFLRKINGHSGTTILLSSHILGEIEKLSTHIGIIDKGYLKFQGTMGALHELLQESRIISIRTNDCTKAFGILKDLYRIPETNDGCIQVMVRDDAEIAAVVKILVGNGIDVYRVSDHQSGLEELFIHVLRK
jgi:ABC-type multidrug transport system ATPase subunit